MGEIRTVDEDERVRLLFEHGGDRLVQAPHQTRQMTQHGQKAHHREIFEREETRQPGIHHPRAADA